MTSCCYRQMPGGKIWTGCYRLRVPVTDRSVRQQHALIIPDGATDLHDAPEATPLALAHTPYNGSARREGATGLMQTLYADLPRESVVAQLGMVGWDPHTYNPNGRASCELLATQEIELGTGDLAFRGNLARLGAGRLQSYSADNIPSDLARPLVERLNAELGARFPSWTLYYNEDFRSTLVVRGHGWIPPAGLIVVGRFGMEGTGCWHVLTLPNAAETGMTI